MKQHLTFRRIAGTLFAACAFLLAGCASAPPPLSQETSALAKYWNITGIQYPASAPLADRPAWEAGQYVMTGTVENGKLTMLTRELIVGKENGGWIIEIVTTDKWGKGAGMQLQIFGLEEAVAAMDPSILRIDGVKALNAKNKVTKPEGKSIEPYLHYANSLYTSMTLSSGEISPGGTAEVPAGIFAGTIHQKTKVIIAGVQIDSDNWYHSAIPVTGLVKSWSNNGKTITELLSFGTDGKAMIK